jgi:hypothetical protein
MGLFSRPFPPIGHPRWYGNDLIHSSLGGGQPATTASRSAERPSRVAGSPAGRRSVSHLVRGRSGRLGFGAGRPENVRHEFSAWLASEATPFLAFGLTAG